MYNDIHGKENHLIKLDRFRNYKPPTKDENAQTVKKKTKKRKRKNSKKPTNTLIFLWKKQKINQK